MLCTAHAQYVILFIAPNIRSVYCYPLYCLLLARVHPFPRPRPKSCIACTPAYIACTPAHIECTPAQIECTPAPAQGSCIVRMKITVYESWSDWSASPTLGFCRQNIISQLHFQVWLILLGSFEVEVFWLWGLLLWALLSSGLVCILYYCLRFANRVSLSSSQFSIFPSSVYCSEIVDLYSYDVLIF